MTLQSELDRFRYEVRRHAQAIDEAMKPIMRQLASDVEQFVVAASRDADLQRNIDNLRRLGRRQPD